MVQDSDACCATPPAALNLKTDADSPKLLNQDMLLFSKDSTME